MMIKKENLVLKDGKRKPIVFDLYYEASTTPLPLVVFCHGYKGFKDWGAWHLVAEEFAKAGFCFLKFNFSHNGGTVEEPIDFPDLEAFSENNFSLELEDLNRVLDHMEMTDDPSRPKISSVSLVGHSRGGGIVLIKAAEDSRISKVATWASVSDFSSRFQEGTPAFEEWRKRGVTYVENSRTKQQLPHKFQFYEDFKANEERFDLRRAVKRIDVPILFVHGTVDPTVPLSEGQMLHSWNRKSRWEEIPGADHVFNTSHPWQNAALSPEMKKVVQLTIDFLK